MVAFPVELAAVFERFKREFGPGVSDTETSTIADVLGGEGVDILREGAGCPGVGFVDVDVDVVVVEKLLREMSGWKVPLDRSGSDTRAADMKI